MSATMATRETLDLATVELDTDGKRAAAAYLRAWSRMTRAMRAAEEASVEMIEAGVGGPALRNAKEAESLISEALVNAVCQQHMLDGPALAIEAMFGPPAEVEEAEEVERTKVVDGVPLTLVIVSWAGRFWLTQPQRRVVAALLDFNRQGTPAVSGEALAEISGADVATVEELFAGTDAVGKLIVPTVPAGYYMLAPRPADAVDEAERAEADAA